MPLLFLDDFALDDIKKQKDSKYSIFFFIVYLQCERQNMSRNGRKFGMNDGTYISILVLLPTNRICIAISIAMNQI